MKSKQHGLHTSKHHRGASPTVTTEGTHPGLRVRQEAMGARGIAAARRSHVLGAGRRRPLVDAERLEGAGAPGRARPPNAGPLLGV